MNISPISCNAIYLKNDNNKSNQTVSFSGGKIATKGNISNIGCSGLGVGALIAAPFLILAGTISSAFKNKDIEIHNICREIEQSFENNVALHKNKSNFDKSKEKMFKILDKSSKNEDYTLFVKESLEYLDKNFEKNDIFPNEEYGLHRFIIAIKVAANAALSKNLKEIDKANIENHIKYAKELINGNLN